MARILPTLALGLGVGLPAAAQDFTTAAEVKPILEATQSQWIAVSESEASDLLYFTNLLAWRCGISAIHYGVNGAAPDTLLVMEPCHSGTATPNALLMENGVVPHVKLDLKSIATVAVKVQFDDDSTLTADYARAAILRP